MGGSVGRWEGRRKRKRGVPQGGGGVAKSPPFHKMAMLVMCSVVGSCYDLGRYYYVAAVLSTLIGWHVLHSWHVQELCRTRVDLLTTAPPPTMILVFRPPRVLADPHARVAYFRVR